MVRIIQCEQSQHAWESIYLETFEFDILGTVYFIMRKHTCITCFRAYRHDKSLQEL